MMGRTNDMEMTEEFSQLVHCFHEAKDSATVNGKFPAKVLFGPQEFEAWENMKKSHDMYVPGFVTLFEGLPVGRMKCPGVAVTSHPPIELGIYKNGFPPS